MPTLPNYQRCSMCGVVPRLTELYIQNGLDLCHACNDNYIRERKFIPEEKPQFSQALKVIEDEVKKLKKNNALLGEIITTLCSDQVQQYIPEVLRNIIHSWAKLYTKIGD